MLNFNLRRGLVLFLIVVMVNLTPAFAVQMEQVANDASDYEKESHESKGFFGKIKFMAKGFRLIDEAKSAEKDSKNDDVQKQTNQSDASNYEAMWDENKLPQQEMQNLLNFKNSKKTGTNSKTGNKTNTTTSNTTSNSTSEVPLECYENAQSIVTQLVAMNITVSQAFEPSVTNTLTGKIVQIIDDNGHLRYLYVKKMDKTKLTLVTNNNTEINMKMDAFKKAYTGVVLSIGGSADPSFIVTKINEIQKNKIQTDIQNVQKLKDESKTNTIIGIILAGVGIVLLVLAVLIAIIYSKVAATPVANNAADTVTVQGQQYTVTTESGFYEDMSSCSTRPPMSHENLMAGTQRTADMLAANNYAMFNILYTLAITGIILTPLAAGELATNAGSNNWVGVVLGIVGLILLVCGIGLIIAGLILGGINVIKWLKFRSILEGLNYEDEDMDKWLNKTDPVITNKTNNTTINLNSTPLFNGTNLNKTF